MAKPTPHVIDFETAAIMPRPDYPPKPCGFSLKSPGDKKSKYYAWGHHVENNCSKEDATRVLHKVWKSGEPLLFHNGKFDVDVAQVHMGLLDYKLDPLLIHDTMFILFLLYPHAFSLGLKPSAEKYLGLKPEEQDVLRDWLMTNQAYLRGQGLIGPTQKITLGNFGAFISVAPGGLVGRYADGDVTRTAKLFNKLYPDVVASGMLNAYQREQKLMPILLRNEREGMRGDAAALNHDLPLYEQAMQDVEVWLRKRLKSPDLDFEKDRQVAEALDKTGVVTEWTLTEKSGQKSLNKKNLKPEHYKDKNVYLALGYRNKLGTCINTYMKPWKATMERSGGILYAGWNQTRNDKDAGTRTGRLSSSPNFMAVAKDFEDKGDGWAHPGFVDVPHLPLIRTYLLPDKSDHVWGRRDYNQQELRILGHFEDGALMEAYVNNVKLDVHQFVQASIYQLLSIELPRTPVKTLNFGLIYGQGVGSMAEKLNRTVEEVRTMRNAQFQALPGLKELDKSIKQRGKTGEPIITWGGRQYYCEDPREINGRWCTFEYKLLNYLIQGSAADCTKEALIRYDSLDNKDARFVVSVHDEINISAHKKVFKAEMLKLRDVMQSIEFDVPMLSDAEYGPNWADMTKLVEK